MIWLNRRLRWLVERLQGFFPKFRWWIFIPAVFGIVAFCHYVLHFNPAWIIFVVTVYSLATCIIWANGMMKDSDPTTAPPVTVRLNHQDYWRANREKRQDEDRARRLANSLRDRFRLKLPTV